MAKRAARRAPARGGKQASGKSGQVSVEKLRTSAAAKSLWDESKDGSGSVPDIPDGLYEARIVRCRAKEQDIDGEMLASLMIRLVVESPEEVRDPENSRKRLKTAGKQPTCWLGMRNETAIAIFAQTLSRLGHPIGGDELDALPRIAKSIEEQQPLCGVEIKNGKGPKGPWQNVRINTVVEGG